MRITAQQAIKHLNEDKIPYEDILKNIENIPLQVLINKKLKTGIHTYSILVKDWIVPYLDPEERNLLLNRHSLESECIEIFKKELNSLKKKTANLKRIYDEFVKKLL